MLLHKGKEMPTHGFALMLICFLSVAASTSGVAQQTSNSINMELKEIGEVKAQVQKYEHALGVVSQLARAANRDIECNGLCYFQNGSNSVAWTCGPGKKCQLYCTVSPPVGRCD